MKETNIFTKEHYNEEHNIMEFFVQNIIFFSEQETNISSTFSDTIHCVWRKEIKLKTNYTKYLPIFAVICFIQSLFNKCKRLLLKSVK